MADGKSSTFWFISQNAASGPGAERAAKEAMGENAGLVTVPYFPLPPHGELFEDTEGRFPMQELKKIIEGADDLGSTYWYARVLPEDGNPARAEYLLLYTVGPLKLKRDFYTVSHRYIITLEVSEKPD